MTPTDQLYPATDPEVRLEIIDTVRRFVAKEVIPVASEFEHADEFPTDIVAQMREMGLFGVTIPEAYGGLGLDLLTYIGVIEELAYGWMSLTGVINTHTMAATLIMAHGSEEQKQRWLPTMATGERRGALSLSEPDAGSDTRNISCKATPDGDEYVIDGTKMWFQKGKMHREDGPAMIQPDGSEYLLLENRVARGFDRDLPGQGLLIWRVVRGRPILEESHGITGPNGPRVSLPLVPARSSGENVSTSVVMICETGDWRDI